MRRRLDSATLLALLAAVLAVATACADGGKTREVASAGSPSASAQTPSQDAFSRCMRENGADLDGNAVTGGGSEGGSGRVDQTQSADLQRRQLEALEKCRQYLPDGGNPQPMSPEELDQARAIAKCMRDAGIDYPDPDPNAAGGPGTRQIPPGVDISDPRVLTLLRGCERQAGAIVVTPGGSS